MEAKLRRHLGETKIEDLWTRFFCVSSNLTTAEPVVHERGPLWKWVKSSGSIPGMAPPVHLQDDLLTDGGLLDNLPVETGRRIGRGRVVAVNVIPSVDRKSFSAYDEKLSPFQLFWQRFRPWGRDRRIPTLLDIVSRATSLASAREIEHLRQNADLFFEPPVTHYGTLEIKAIDAIVEAGYRDAIAKLSGDGLADAASRGA
jgi:predicted acylesterase/phospholipase RssA